VFSGDCLSGFIIFNYCDFAALSTFVFVINGGGAKRHPKQKRKEGSGEGGRRRKRRKRRRKGGRSEAERKQRTIHLNWFRRADLFILIVVCFYYGIRLPRLHVCVSVTGRGRERVRVCVLQLHFGREHVTTPIYDVSL